MYKTIKYLTESMLVVEVDAKIRNEGDGVLYVDVDDSSVWRWADRFDEPGCPSTVPVTLTEDDWAALDEMVNTGDMIHDWYAWHAGD